MVVPLEMALVFGALAVLMIRDAMRSEMSNTDRVGSVIVGLGCIMMVIGGRFPPLPDETGVPATAMAGVWVMLGGSALRIAGTIASLVQKLGRWHRGSKQLK